MDRGARANDDGGRQGHHQADATKCSPSADARVAQGRRPRFLVRISAEKARAVTKDDRREGQQGRQQRGPGKAREHAERARSVVAFVEQQHRERQAKPDRCRTKSDRDTEQQARADRTTSIRRPQRRDQEGERNDIVLGADAVDINDRDKRQRERAEPGQGRPTRTEVPIEKQSRQCARQRAQAIERDRSAAPKQRARNFMQRIPGKSRNHVLAGLGDVSRRPRDTPGVDVDAVARLEKWHARCENDREQRQRGPDRALRIRRLAWVGSGRIHDSIGPLTRARRPHSDRKAQAASR